MSSFFDKLNLKPAERRLVIIVGIVIFVLLNAFFVWPYFGEWGRVQKRKREAGDLLKAYQTEVDNTARYQKQLADLQQAGAAVATEEQASRLSTTINNQAALSGVQVNGFNINPRTSAAAAKQNQFFEETSANLQVTTEEKGLVDFLYNLGTGGSLIRVRSMSIAPDQPRHRLAGRIELVASYAKRQPARPAAGAPAPATHAVATARSTNTGARPNFGASRTNAARTNAPISK